MNAVPIEKIVRSRRRSVALIITQDATLIVRAPLYTPSSVIEDFVRDKSFWIRRKIDEAAAHRAQARKVFFEGERFLYLGEHYPLSLVEASPVPLVFDDAFRLERSFLPDAKSLFVGWYRRQAGERIPERVEFYSALSGIRHYGCRITNTRSRWASCSGEGYLRFSWRLIMAPLNVVDYVVVHELAHVAHKDHSTAFWNRVASIFPDYKRTRKWLRLNGHLLTV